jgi:isopenicillin-N N-acyltransferase like protein
MGITSLRGPCLTTEPPPRPRLQQLPKRACVFGVNEERLSRRAFGLSGAAVLGALVGCRPRPVARKPEPPAPRRRPADARRMTLLEASGTPFELGVAVGRETGESIRAVLRERATWWQELQAFARAQPSLVDRFLVGARRHCPEAVDELRGLAQGSGLPFQDLLVQNLQAELGSLREARAKKAPEPSTGCSTIVLRAGGRAFLAHNEDGDRAYLERMVLLRLRPAGQPSVLAACYPGLLPGNAPWVNERGVVMTCNFIASREVRAGGVGRLFLHRATMQARDVDQALATAKHPERAYSYHCVLAALGGGEATSLEVTAGKSSTENTAGLYLHTNHLVHEAMAGEAQEPEYVGSSSMSRWNVLTEWKSSVEDVDALEPDALLSVLSSHQSRPYSPCRHPEGDVRGATVLTALFDLRARQLRLYRGQPCSGRFEDLAI